MAYATDRLALNDHELFRKVRENLPDNRSKTKNLMECKDDVLFVWDPATDSLLTLNLKAAGEGSSKYQVFIDAEMKKNFVAFCDLVTAVKENSCFNLGHEIINSVVQPVSRK